MNEQKIEKGSTLHMTLAFLKALIECGHEPREVRAAIWFVVSILEKQP